MQRSWRRSKTKSWNTTKSSKRSKHAVNNQLDHDSRAHETRAMKNVTFSADEETIELARAEARAQNTTLNALFRDWLDDIAQRDQRRDKIDAVFEEMAKYNAGGSFTREEMNER